MSGKAVRVVGHGREVTDAPDETPEETAAREAVAEHAAKIASRVLKITDLRSKVRQGTATAAQKDKLLTLLAGLVLQLEDDLD
jgi:hypothetical protein